VGPQPKTYPVINENNNKNNKVVGVISRRRVLKALLDNNF